MKIGDRIFVRGYIDEIRKDTVIVRNDGGYFGTIPSEVTGELPSVEWKKGRWINHRNDNGHNIADCSECGNAIQWFDDDEKPKFCCMCGADMRERKEV